MSKVLGLNISSNCQFLSFKKLWDEKNGVEFWQNSNGVIRCRLATSYDNMWHRMTSPKSVCRVWLGGGGSECFNGDLIMIIGFVKDSLVLVGQQFRIERQNSLHLTEPAISSNIIIGYH